MDINTVVELVQLATTENPRKLQATQILDQLRSSPDRWNVGLRLFVETSNEMARFFGLSLVRDWMQGEIPHTQSATDFREARDAIRSTMMSWLSQLLQSMSQNSGAVVPFFLLSNAISVVTLSIKFDFPLCWPTAFKELLQLGYAHGIPGIDVVVKVLKELEVEVVMFSETRSKEEILTNTAVKDAMRESSVMQDIVSFLCQSAQHALSMQRADVCASCLHALGELIAWIDVALVLDQALPVVYRLWQESPHATVRTACCYCFYELVKKGMDPVAKVRLLHGVNLVGLLAQDQRLQTLLSNSSAARPGRGAGLTPEEEKEVEQAGALVDMIVLELFGCWTKYEDLACGKTKAGAGSPSSGMNSGASTPSGGGDTAELVNTVPVVVSFLQQLSPLLLQVFGHPVLKVSSMALPSCTRLVALLRTQQLRAGQLQALAGSNGSGAAAVFRAEDYLYPLLSAVYTKSQYPDGFDFEAALEDELDEETEAKNEVRKLFVNCCRVRPDRCLELLCAVMSSQPLPLSKAPYSPLEAALRLVHAFSECGPGHAKLLAEGAFPALIRALHDSDVSLHAHPQVVLVYFEISHRYIRYLSRDAILRLCQALLGRQGVQSSNVQLRGRAAYFILKVAESQEGKNANVVDSVYAQLSAILTETASVELRSAFTKKPSVSEQSELYLCEAVAQLTSIHATSNASNGAPSSPHGVELLRGIVDIQLGQMHHALCLLSEQPQLVEAIGAVLTRRMAALAGLTKGYSCKGQPAAVPVFENAAAAVVAVTQRLATQRSLRGKILIFLHRMVACLGQRVLSYQDQLLPVLLASADASDADDVVQVLNQLMVEYGPACLPLVEQLFGAVVDKYSALSAAMEAPGATVLPTATASDPAAIQAPHLQTERLTLHRQYLLFLQHIATYGCSSVLFSPAHLHRLEGILFSVVLPAISGGAVSADPAPEQSSTGLKINPNHIGNTDTQDSVPVRKGALVILNGLTTAWLLPPSPGAVASPPPAEVAAALRAYVLEHALPRAMHSVSAWCTGQQRSQLNVKDAAAQSVLVELAALLRAVHSALAYDLASQSATNPQASPAYFLKMLQALGWPEQKAQIFYQQLAAPTPLGAFKDAFKLFIRDCSP